MKLAEALMVRSDLKKKLASLRERLQANVMVQEGTQAHEEPGALIKEAAGVLDEMEGLVLRIDSANAAARLPDGRSLAQAIAARDRLTQHHSLLQVAISASRKEPARYSMAEIKWVTMVDVAGLQKQSDDLSKRIRELNALIQGTNWRVEIE